MDFDVQGLPQVEKLRGDKMAAPLLDHFRAGAQGVTMIHHFAAWTGETWAVAYHSPTLGPVALTDGMSQESATSEAARLNFESAARAAMAPRGPAYYGQRRVVRQFVNEDIHG